MISLKGTYKDGKVTLNKPYQTDRPVKVIVTFLEETSDNGENIPQPQDLKPMTMEEFNARHEQAMDDSHNGRLIDAEDILKEIDARL